MVTWVVEMLDVITMGSLLLIIVLNDLTLSSMLIT